MIRLEFSGLSTCRLSLLCAEVTRAHGVGADMSHYRNFANRREYDRWLEIYDHQFGKLGEFVKGQEMGEEIAALAHVLLTMMFLSFTVMLLRFVMF